MRDGVGRRLAMIGAVLVLAAGVPVPAVGAAAEEAGADRFSVEADGNRLTVWRAVPVGFAAIDRLTAALLSPMPPQAHVMRLDRRDPPERIHYVFCVTSEGTLVLGQQTFSSGGPAGRPVLVRGEIVRSYPPLEASGAWTWLVEVPVSREREVVLAVRATSLDWPVRAVMIVLAAAGDPVARQLEPATPASRRRRSRRRAGGPGAICGARRWPARGRHDLRPPAAGAARRHGRWQEAVRVIGTGLAVLFLAGCAGVRHDPAPVPVGVEPGPVPRVLAPPPSPPAPASSDQLRLAEQLARIAGEVGDLQNALAKVVASAQQHEGQLQAVERRILELESRARGVAAPRGFAPAGPPMPAPAAPVPPAGAPSRRSDPPNDLYGTALEKYRAGDVDAAILTLQELIANHPSDPLRDRAQYRLAEIFYAQKDLRAALQEYQDLAAAVPPGPRAPSALLKLGLCYRGLGDEARARLAWERLAKDFPGSPAAQQARSLLR
jgi:tol-pal system protein YbgF